MRCRKVEQVAFGTMASFSPKDGRASIPNALHMSGFWIKRDEDQTQDPAEHNGGLPACPGRLPADPGGWGDPHSQKMLLKSQKVTCTLQLGAYHAPSLGPRALQATGS